MKQSFVLATLAATALATPLEKRWESTAWVIDTVTVTVTGQAPAQTPDNKWQGQGPWGGNWNNGWSSPAAAPTTTAAPAPAPSSVAPVASSPAPAAPSAGGWGSGSGGSAPSNAWSSSAPASTAQTGDYQTDILNAHNTHRQNASVPALTWDDNMASIAAQIASSCVYAHNTQAGGGGYGQNIGAGADNSGVPAMINNEMYNGEINYYPGYGSEPDMSNFEQWGHYSQIVWKSTTGVGCATQYCPGGLANTGGDVSPYFTVCNYSPPGNFGGEYAANVLQPGNMPTITL